jgi:serine protease Do
MRKIKFASYFAITGIIIQLFIILNVKAIYHASGFNITGNVKGLKNGSKLLILIKRGDTVDTVSRAVAKNEHFVFQNVKLPVAPDFYLICIQTEFVENLSLFLGRDGDVNIIGNLKSWPNVTVTGSKIPQDFLQAEGIRKEEWDGIFAVKYPTKTAPMEDILMYSEKGIAFVVKQMPNSLYLPAMLVTWTYTSGKFAVPIEMKKPYYDKLSDAQKNSHYGKILGKQIEALEQSVKWMGKLKDSAERLSSVSREGMVKQLSSAVLPVRLASPLVPSKMIKLDEKEIVNKTKAATLIVNMAYVQIGVEGMQTNPTTAYVINEAGVCVTNYHVFKEYARNDQYKSISVMTAEGKSYPVTKVLSCSESDDLVVFQVDTKGEKLSALPLGNTAANGTAIYVMSHPMQNFYRFTSGIIAGNTTAMLAGQPCDIMKITADFNVGSSGGPIVDGFGNVVGTVSRIDGNGAKVGIPVSALRKLIELK